MHHQVLNQPYFTVILFILVDLCLWHDVDCLCLAGDRLCNEGVQVAAEGSNGVCQVQAGLCESQRGLCAAVAAVRGNPWGSVRYRVLWFLFRLFVTRVLSFLLPFFLVCLCACWLVCT